MKNLLFILISFSIVSSPAHAKFLKKSTLFLSLFLLLTTLAYTQSDKRPAAVLCADAVNIVYIGLDNPINVSVPGYQFDQIILKTDFGELTLKDGQYFLSVKDSRQQITKLTISVFIKEDLKLIPVGSKEFNILRVPNPTPVLDGFSGGNISQYKLKYIDSVYIAMDCFYFNDLKYEVTSFNFLCQSEGKAVAFSAKGNKLTAEMKENLIDLKPGDIIIVANIYAKAGFIENKQLPGAIVLDVVE